MRPFHTVIGAFLLTGLTAIVAAQTPPQAPAPTRTPAPAQVRQPRPAQTPAAKVPAKTAPNPGPTAEAPPDYVIGPDDVLGVLFWRDADMSGDVTVRPDGMVTIPLIREIKAAGLKPDQLREQIQKAASQYIEDPVVTVVVRTINSRKVYITGQVARPGPYPLTTAMTVMQLIAVAGGLSEFADEKNITIMRDEGPRRRVYKFNYKDVAKGKTIQQNILLLPGDTVVVP